MLHPQINRELLMFLAVLQSHILQQTLSQWHLCFERGTSATYWNILKTQVHKDIKSYVQSSCLLPSVASVSSTEEQCFFHHFC